MAKYRGIYKTIWKDPDFQNYDYAGKLIFIYLCTNESTTESGIYPVTIATIANETGLQKVTVEQRLDNGLKNVIYDFTHKIVFVRKFHLYNPGGSPALIRKSIINDFMITSDSPLWNDFLDQYPEFHDGIPTVGKPLANHVESVCSKGIGNGIGNGKGKGKRVEGIQGEIPALLNNKKTYGEQKNVFLSDEEYEKLKKRFGDTLPSRIENLSSKIKMHGYKYTDFYLTILKWAEKDDKEKKFSGEEEKSGKIEGLTVDTPE